jgi:alpha-N-arabinofuranosidase
MTKIIIKKICIIFLIGAFISGCKQNNSRNESYRKVKTDREITKDFITVDASKILNDTRRRQIGINTCFFTDDDKCWFRKPISPYNDALKELNVKYLRYPGGWKSDILFWSKPPYQKVDPYLVYKGPKSWPTSDTNLVNQDGSWRIDPYDFDEFIETCQDIHAEPVVVVCYNSCRWPLLKGYQRPTKEQVIENAVSWVRYANIEKGYDVKYWEIGNETWLDYTGIEGTTSKIAPDIYGTDLFDIATAMKAIDPEIFIGANGNSEDYWTEVLDKAASVIDYLSVHTYPLYGWKSYDDYLNKDSDPTGILKSTKKVLASNPVTHGKNILMMMTEWASGTFFEWDREGANLGRAIITFDLQGQLLQDPDCYFSQFWNTINVYEGDNSVFNALYRDNTLTSVGRALWLWGQYLQDEMLGTTSSSMVKCFATRTSREIMNIFLVNRDTLTHKIQLEVLNENGLDSRGGKWVFTGTSLKDQNPEWRESEAIRLKGGKLKDILGPFSVTMYTFCLGN